MNDMAPLVSDSRGIPWAANVAYKMHKCKICDKLINKREICYHPVREDHRVGVSRWMRVCLDCAESHYTSIVRGVGR